MLKKQRDFNKIKVMLVQLIVALVAGISVSQIYHAEVNDVTIYIIGLLHIGLFYMTNCYEHYDKRGMLEEIKRTFLYSIGFILSMALLSFITKGRFRISRRGMFYFISLNGLMMISVNRCIQTLRKKYIPELLSSKKVFLVTTCSRLPYIEERMKRAGAWGGKIVGVTLLDGHDQSNAVNSQFKQSLFIPKKDMIHYVTRSVVDEVFINIPTDSAFNVTPLLADFEQMGIDVSLNISALDFRSEGDKKVQNLAGHTVVTFSTKFYNYGHIMAKRLMDIVGALRGLSICGVVAIVIGPIITLTDGGPILFSQKRVGKNGRCFNFYKFRSMYTDAEERKKELMEKNEMNGLMFKIQNDPRVTPIGRFIRKTSLDELPQFWNVLIGDMSLVGTRPPTLDEYQQYTSTQKRRLSFRPGITGLWQISGRSDLTDFDQIVKLDVAYIDNWSIWNDIKILIKTVKVVLKGSGAQ